MSIEGLMQDLQLQGITESLTQAIAMELSHYPSRGTTIVSGNAPLYEAFGIDDDEVVDILVRLSKSMGLPELTQQALDRFGRPISTVFDLASFLHLQHVAEGKRS